MKKVLGYVAKPKEETIDQMLGWYTNICDLPKNKKEFIKYSLVPIKNNYKKQPIQEYRIVLERIK